MNRNHICLSKINEAIKPEEFRFIIKNFSDLMCAKKELKKAFDERIDCVKSIAPHMRDYLEGLEIELEDELDAHKFRYDRNLKNKTYHSKQELINDFKANVNKIRNVLAFTSVDIMPFKEMTLRYNCFVFDQCGMDLKLSSKRLNISEKKLLIYLKKALAVVAKSDLLNQKKSRF